MSEDSPKFDESALRNGGKLYYDKESKTIKTEPSFKDQQISSLQAELGKEVREKFEIDGANQRLTIELEKAREEIANLNCQLLGDVTLSDWAKEHLYEIDRLRNEVADLQQQLAASKLKYDALELKIIDYQQAALSQEENCAKVIGNLVNAKKEFDRVDGDKRNAEFQWNGWMEKCKQLQAELEKVKQQLEKANKSRQVKIEISDDELGHAFDDVVRENENLRQQLAAALTLLREIQKHEHCKTGACATAVSGPWTTQGGSCVAHRCCAAMVDVFFKKYPELEKA